MPGIISDEAIWNIDDFLHDSIDTWKIPGAVILISEGNTVRLHKAYGYAQTTPSQISMKKNSIFDLASLTKVVAAWPAIMFLIDQKLISLQHRLSHFYSHPLDASLKNTTIFQLLTHTSGLSERTYLKQYGQDKEVILKGILSNGLAYPPDQQVKYSNRGFVLLGDIIERVTGMDLDAFLKQHIWRPLKMKDTTYNPVSSYDDRIVATEYIAAAKKVKRGIVHDENAELLGGIAGHAGTFSTAKDVGAMCNMILDTLNSEAGTFLSKDLIERSFHNYTNGLNEARGLAWQIYHHSKDSLIAGHYGFTGTTVWVDLKKNVYMVLLTNRVHPSRDNMNIHSIRQYIRKVLFPVWNENRHDALNE